MTDAQTEARAIWLAATREEICNDGGAIDVIATALSARDAAKDAELARRDMQLEASAKVALDLSAQLAEARKALTRIAEGTQGMAAMIARRALEAQGGENGRR